MADIKIYNSLTGCKETFLPESAGDVRMYVCGMTVYDYCHLGHARVMVAFDVITRYLRERGYGVTYVRNITDVDDKIFNRANENGEDYTVLTQRFIDAMHEDERALQVLPPDQEPRATDHIETILAMISTLIEKGYAYAADNGDVYYRVREFADYGKLSNRNLDDLQAGARIEVEEKKEDPLDFALWKAAKPNETAWDSPWGEGRPGWHIECSAMSTCCLGDTFDIHGGGPDLKFPHHENEIAQSEAATGKPYVNTWMHAGAVRVDGEKMSKSLGNFFTIREILAKYDAEVVRYLLVSSHYRSAINYSEDSLKQARQNLERFYTALRDSAAAKGGLLMESYVQRFHEAMSDDFNTPEALAVMFDLTRELNRAIKEGSDEAADLRYTLKCLGDNLGLLYQQPVEFLQGGGTDDGLADTDIENLIAERNQARADKNWARSDEVRDQLLAQGVVLEDSREGTTWRRQ